MASTEKPERTGRLLRAILLSLVAALLSGSLIGLAAANDDSDAATGPDITSFGVAAPHRDDTAHYAASTEIRGPHGTIEATPETDHTRYWWTEPTFRHDADGQPHGLERLAVVAHGDEPEHPTGPIPRVYAFDRSTWVPVTTEEAYSAALSHETLLPTHREERRQEGHIVGYQHQETFDHLPCGPLNALQGATPPTDLPLQLFPPCSHPGVAGTVDGTFTFLGSSTHDGHVYAWYTRAANETQPQIIVTFRDDLPYPLRIEAGPDDGDAYTILRLFAFHRGTGPIGGDPSDQPPLAPGRTTPTTDWILDDRSAWQDHPFRLQEAYTWAFEQDTALRGFLDRNPGAYLHAAAMREHLDTDAQHWTWQLRFGIGDAAHMSCPQRSIVERAGLTIQDEVAQAPDCDDRWSTKVPPAPPTSAPELEWMLETYRHRAETGDAEANGYGFEWSCQDAGCLTPQLITRVGRDHHTGRDTPPTKPGGALPGLERAMEHTWLSFTSDARVHMAFVQTSGPAEGSTPSASLTDDVSLRTIGHEPVAPWRLPTATEAAGIGLFALLLGAIYWFWPTLNHGVFSALFSRIDRPKVLAHEDRARVFALVEAEPGLHAREIVRRSGLSRGAVRHHLDKLVDTGLLMVTRGRGYSCYHPAATDRNSARAAPALRAPTAQALVAHLLAHPGTSLSAAARALGVSKQALARHVARLEEAGLLTRHHEGTRTRLVLTDRQTFHRTTG